MWMWMWMWIVDAVSRRRSCGRQVSPKMDLDGWQLWQETDGAPKYYVPRLQLLSILNTTICTMVPIRSTSLLRPSPNHGGHHNHPTHRLIFYSTFIAALGLTAIYLFSPRQHDQQQQQQQQQVVASLRGSATISDVGQPKQSFSDIEMTKSKGLSDGSEGSTGNSIIDSTLLKNKDELDEEDIDPLKITQGSVTYNGDKNLSYYHCGPIPSSSLPQSTSGLTELVLLHGSAFTKENWKSSGILDMFCEINNNEDEGNLSILALDLPVSADGTELGYAFDALVLGNILSGMPVTVVTPSASGYAIISLGEGIMTKSSSSMKVEDKVDTTRNKDGGGSSQSSNNLTRMVKAWIPVASFAVLSASDETLMQYTRANIPILAIHGDKDLKGKSVTERLKDTNDNAKGVELEGRHPVYLDSPEEFVREVMQFLDEMGL